MKNIVKSFAFILVLVFGFFLFITSNHVAGVRSFIVKSGSMEPAIPTGALVVTKAIHPSLLRPGDVITFVRPTEERDFITHRVAGISTRNDYISIKTKGDNNNVPDNWQVGGGNVIGKVNLAVPWLGYILSFVQSKIGILLFILIPAIYILVEEVSTIIKMFRKQESYATESVETAVVLLAILFGISTTQVAPTQALLSDTTVLSNNTFTVVLEPTITSSPKPCGGTTTITVSGNGEESKNTVKVHNECEEYF